MEALSQFLSQHVIWAPFIIFGLLLLAGFNVPISEDAMLFISAILAVQNPDYLWPLFMGVFLGAYISDIICYYLGRFLGVKLFQVKNKFIRSMASPEKIAKIQMFYEKYGIFTLLFGRFIPFGVRNGLFLTAGIGKMSPVKFILSDFVACITSCSIFFAVYYKFGEQAIESVKKANGIIFLIALIPILLFFLFKKFRKIRKRN